MSEKAAVLSSRIRLARNLKDMRMPVKMNGEDFKNVEYRVKAAVQSDREDMEFHSLSEMDELERNILAEERRISRDLVRSSDVSSFLINKEKNLTVMINEEDQIRIQSLSDGLNLKEAWKNASEIDDTIDKYLDYAYDSHFGYLTACPTNTGTGMRASVMVHLPFLTASKLIEKISNSVGKIGVVIRGYYGEGSNPIGAIYQISNQTTSGESEEDIIRKIEAIVTQIVYKETLARRKIIRSRGTEVEDRIFRSYGVLKNSRILELKESMDLLSYLRIGVVLGLLDIDKKVLDDLAVITQPANIERAAGKGKNHAELNKKRAEIFREALSEQEG